ncbi:hypothetical protein GQ43DRAFT_496211 [Delitschia confertaspora ATCC 74209]|uniref:Uncharacterized protein n=1 Tax=Delitschia confertaspora ATCC 74209 TaxID=1513339 RepID=A0A9P4N003_9PLEO|nr:hypothetical protein GQ43DRAFT_496211 [Delitschia confertaspora ATCC 74209]
MFSNTFLIATVVADEAAGLTIQRPPMPPLHYQHAMNRTDAASISLKLKPLFDNRKDIIGGSNINVNNGRGVSINNDSPLGLTSQLPYVLMASGQHEGQHEGQYVHFAYGGTQWESNKPGGRAECTVGKWDRNKKCFFLGLKDNGDVHREMDCFFPC